MEFVRKGIYTYSDGFWGINNNALPIEMVISDRIPNEAILIRLLCGTLKLKYPLNGRDVEIEQRKNYSIPGIGENNGFKYKKYEIFFRLIISEKPRKKV